MYIREFRKKKNMTQAELAEILEVHENTLRRWENGSFEPRSNDLLKLCKALGCTEAELLNGSTKQEFEVKILMGVKTLPSVAGIEITDNSFFYGVDEEKPQIHIGGMINIGTPQEREESLKKIIASFQKACWMFDHKGEAEAEMPDFSAILTAIQPA